MQRYVAGSARLMSAIIERLVPEQMFGPEDIERLAAHIAQVCVSGLRGPAAPTRVARR